MKVDFLVSPIGIIKRKNGNDHWPTNNKLYSERFRMLNGVDFLV